LVRQALGDADGLIDAVRAWRDAHKAVASARTRYVPPALLVQLQFTTNALLRIAGRLG
jgi:hypothetical protein